MGENIYMREKTVNSTIRYMRMKEIDGAIASALI
jgi:hypothetical protein